MLVFFKKLTLLYFALLLAILPLNSFALSSDDLDDIFSYSLEELLQLKVEGSSHSNKDVSSAPAKVIIFDRNKLDRLLVRDMSDLLRYVPGVDIIDNDHWYGELYSVRGITGNDRFLVLLNGNRINSKSGFFLSVGNSLSLTMAEKVEVIFGSSSVTYGTDAFAGVINIITKTDITESSLKFGMASGNFNTRDVWLDGQLIGDDDKWLRFYARKFTSNGFNLSGQDYLQTFARYPSTIKNTFSQPIDDYNLMFEWQWNDFKGGMFRQAFNEGNGRGLGIGEGPFLTIMNEDNFFKFTNDLFWANWDLQLDDSNLTMQLNYSDFQIDSNAKFLEFTDTTYTNITPFYKTGIDHSARFSTQYQFSVNEKINALFGGEWQRIRSIPPYANDIVFGTPTIPYNSQTANLLDITQIWETKSAFYSELDYQISQNFSFLVDLRFDYSARYQNAFNSRAALNYKLSDKSFFKLIYGTSFQAPSLNFVNEQWGNEFFIMVPNTSQQTPLRAQNVKSFEIEWQQEFSENTIFTTSYYHSNLTDLIEYVFLESVFNRFANDFTQGLRFENIGNQKVQGIELSFTKKWSKFEFNSNYSFLDAKRLDDPSDTQIPLLSRHKLWLGGSYPFSAWTASINARWISRPTTTQDNIRYPGNQKGPNYVRVDLALQSELLAQHWRWSVKVNNLFDRKIEHIGSSNASTSVIPQPGINGMIGIEYTF